jgi:hypothetical protein
MAQDNTGVSAPTKQMTAAEMQQWIQDHDRALKNYAAALDPIKQLRDVTKSSTRRIRSLTKDNIVTYLQNPISNEAKLRNASWYIFYRNQIYQRIVFYYSTLFCLDARTVIPRYDLVKPDSDDKILKAYNDTLTMMSNWNIENEFLKVIITCMLQDVSYNVAYYDETGLYLLPLPADYCKIYAQYPTGDYAFMFDCSYLRGTNNWLVDAWGEPFTTMWRQYEKEGNAGRWQPVPDEYAACFKKNNFDWETILPPFIGVLGDLINLNDIADNQAVSDALDIYKLVYMKLKTITGAKMPDEWQVNPEISIEYARRLIDEALPDYVSFGIVPGDEDLGVVDFSNIDKSNETTKVLKAAKTVLNASGGAQVLNSAEISGTTAYHAALHADENFAMSSLLPQIQGWFNRILPFAVTNPAKVKFFFVGRFTKDEYRKELLENAQYSLPTKLAIMSLSGVDPLDTLSLNHLEENLLKLGDKFNDPLKSSYTSSNSSSGGRPTSDDSDLTDEGERARDKDDLK